MNSSIEIHTAMNDGAGAMTATTSRSRRAEEKTRILVLISTLSGIRQQGANQQRAMDLLQAEGIPWEALDCGLPEHREQREALFEKSGIRGDLPQFFLVTNTAAALPQPEGSDSNVDNSEALTTTPTTTTTNITFIGQLAELEEINENSKVPPYLFANSDSWMTWDKLLGRRSSAATRKDIRPEGMSFQEKITYWTRSTRDLAMPEISTPDKDTEESSNNIINSKSKSKKTKPSIRKKKKVSISKDIEEDLFTPSSIPDSISEFAASLALQQETNNREQAAQTIQRFLKKKTIHNKSKSSEDVQRDRFADEEQAQAEIDRLQQRLDIIKTKKGLELARIQKDLEEQRTDLRDKLERQVENDAKTVKKLIKQTEKQKKKNKELKKQLKEEKKRGAKLRKVGKYQRKLDKKTKSWHKVQAKVEKEQQTLDRLEGNIAAVSNGNDRLLTCIQQIADTLEQHGISWAQLLAGDDGPAAEKQAVKKKWWIKEENTTATISTITVGKPPEDANEKPSTANTTATPSAGQKKVKTLPEKKNKKKKSSKSSPKKVAATTTNQISPGVKNKQAVDMSGPIWSRSGGRPTHMLQRLSNSRQLPALAAELIISPQTMPQE